MDRDMTDNVDYIEICRELNAELYERFKEVEFGFEYQTNGFVDIISFGGFELWNSEMDDREWIDEWNDYESFEPYIQKVFNKFADKMQSLKF